MNPGNLPSGQDGYHRLATLMTKEQSLAIFRRFDFVNVLCLLSLQAEIQELQSAFDDLCKRDRFSGDPEKQIYSHWFKALKDGEDGSSHQYKKLKELREKVKEYSTQLKIPLKLSLTAISRRSITSRYVCNAETSNERVSVSLHLLCDINDLQFRI
jgi:hypothetical protein